MRNIAHALMPLAFTGFFLLPPKHISLPAADDGPYVLYKDGKVFAKYITEANGAKKVRIDSADQKEKENITLHVNGDEPGSGFSVKLKSELKNEKAEYKGIKKMFVLSDIEGNFRAFRRLLTANEVIDKDFNWTFGEGHLVLTGDFLDRGNMVTEVLWLIYSLEDKAKAAGGYVHFILGNHEIMNLGGDIRYVNEKYIHNASLLKENYTALYGEDAELGKWLRTKNVVERVGDILFTHGGISSQLNSLDLSLTKINKLVRAFYGDSSYSYPNAETDLLYGKYGPFWYRGYYTGELASTYQIDSTLSLYNVKQIATGHSVIADTISILHKGKLIDTDVHHAGGKSEGLLIEGGKYYRADAVGQHFLILQK